MSKEVILGGEEKNRFYRKGGCFMHGFLENVGLLAIFFAVTYGYKKILEYNDSRRIGLPENKKVYQAANEFVRGAETGNVKAILDECFEFEEEDIKKILSRAIPHRTDQDGGYRAFIRSVNKVVGDDLYDERYPHIES